MKNIKIYLETLKQLYKLIKLIYLEINEKHKKLY